MIVEGGYNLPEGTAVERWPRTRSTRSPGQAEDAKDKHQTSARDDGTRRAGARMSVAAEPQPRRREGGINLVALARPYFGLIVLTTVLLTAFGVCLDAPDAQRHLPRGGLPADRGHRAVAGLAGQGRRGGRHAADRGGGQHRPGRRSASARSRSGASPSCRSTSRPAPT